MPPRRVTRGRRATSAEQALLAEPPQNSSVAEKGAQLERDTQASARSLARRSRSRGRERSRMSSSSSSSSPSPSPSPSPPPPPPPPPKALVVM